MPLSINMIQGLSGLSVVANRNTAKARQVIGWYFLENTLWAYSDLSQTIALKKLHDEKEIQLLPEHGAFLKPNELGVRYSHKIDVLSGDTIANPNGFYELFDLGERLSRYEAEEDTLMARAYGRELWEETEGKILPRYVKPFNTWHFQYVDIHEKGIRLFTPNDVQVLIMYRFVEYKTKPRRVYDAKLSDKLKKIE